MRTLGVLRMVDGGENDEKVICVATDDITKDHIRDLADLGPEFPRIVEHYYAHYKDWKKDWKGTEVSFNGWGDAAAAIAVIEDSISRFNATQG
jgi:inorganic pyrophosphatase